MGEKIIIHYYFTVSEVATSEPTVPTSKLSSYLNDSCRFGFFFNQTKPCTHPRTTGLYINPYYNCPIY